MTGVAENVQVDPRAALLLRRWLAETHTPIEAGPLKVTIGPLRFTTEVTYRSPTGAHGFGPIRVADSGDLADSALLAAACSADARGRATADAPINAEGSGTLLDWLLDAVRTGAVDPLTGNDEVDVLGQGVSSQDEARRWLASHVESTVTPALRNLDERADLAEVTARLLTRRSLAAIGRFGLRGVADEQELLVALAEELGALADTYPDTERVIRHWLDSATLTDLAVLNGSGLRYLAEGKVAVSPVRYEVPNPMRATAADGVPGVPVPELGDGWSLRPVALNSEDPELVHRWMNEDHVAVNWNQAWSLQRWRNELGAQLGGQHSVPCIVRRDGRDVAYVELYRVVRDKLATCYPLHPRDLGVHIAIGEKDAIGRGFGSSLLEAVAHGLLAADPECARVVAEPNVHNGASVAAFGKAGFVRAREVGLPGKNSALMVHDR
ncbi:MULTISPECIES: GNAT family N-acetyltransferase [unclassified Saccharopolyspora]|uniref:GNAT family N-acetyltransferase n=1 Tax=unclassified Saccharopolyspora TaxID=2646250 RepID=UPI001CD333E2|nr:MULTISPECIES: GNAT family N-acetyltransferase [unclassified Saccharopolyspora]MCA1193724.1 acetyltransferase [Saccharopolyspora sp. 6V]MCA1282501.1 acetyltransferase [Saccharopolyspora sp. 7B]